MIMTFLHSLALRCVSIQPSLFDLASNSFIFKDRHRTRLLSNPIRRHIDNLQHRHRLHDWASVQDRSSPTQTPPSRQPDVTLVPILPPFTHQPSALLLGLPSPTVSKTKAIRFRLLHPKSGQQLQPAIVRLCERTKALWSPPPSFTRFRDICFFRVHHRFFADQSRC